ncbi:hypothetical protein [Shewanella sp.]|uniref:hypothetical protein n=1 Tax=Shewanella sp. TaxID=50422 RepID=UPI003F366677
MKTKSELFTLINDRYPDNSTQFIKAVNLREVSTQTADSSLNLADTAEQTALGVTNFQPGVKSKNSPVLIGGQVIEILRSASLVSQAPTVVSTPIQIAFGAATGTVTDAVMLSAAGLLTFNRAGTYAVRVKLQVGRTGASGISRILSRLLKNGSPVGVPEAAFIESPNQVMARESRVTVSAVAGDTLAVQFIRDPSGDNSGGLVAFAATGAIASWGTAPSALLVVEKFQGAV